MEFDVGKDKEALEEMVAISGKRMVPVIVVGSEHRVGFDPREISALLSAQD